MGEYTKNNFFYKPHLGARGEDEKNKFDAALDYTDAVLADLKNKNILNSNGQISLSFLQTPILVNGQDLMSRTFYVDTVNGSDSNSGTSSAPFATIKKAIDSVPVGGKGTIYIVANSDVVIQESDISIYNKYIEIYKSGSGTVTIKKSKPTSPDFGVANSVLKFTNINFLGLPKDASITYDYNWVAHFYLKASTVAIFYSNIALDNGSFVVTTNGLGFSSLYIHGCSITTTSDTVAVLKFVHDIAFYVFKLGSTIDDTTKHISGIIKDTNGVPRNVVSNLIL